ncbi:MAG: transcription factor FapR [Firmicutes bacterium]|nr:transcription factor FapR [Bacillota bacterium]
MKPRLQKTDRLRRLAQVIEDDPFITDRELAGVFGVSIQTVRLDRLELGIPESRERTRRLAEEATNQVRSVETGEVIGELIHVKLGQEGISVLETDKDMAFRRTSIVRGHHIFAQANSLAVSLVDAEVALTGTAAVKYLRPVKAGERLVAKAEILSRSGRRHVVKVTTKVGHEDVFAGEFTVFAVEEPEGSVRTQGGVLIEDCP